MLLPVMASEEFSVAQTQRLHHILGSVLDAYAAAGFSDDTANTRCVLCILFYQHCVLCLTLAVRRWCYTQVLRRTAQYVTRIVLSGLALH
jgi:hypothetical protein